MTRPRPVLALGFYITDGIAGHVAPELARPDPSWPSTLRREVAQGIVTPPTLDELRQSGKVYGAWPDEAVRRYERERLEYLEDVRAFWEVYDEFEDRISRAVRGGLRLRNAGDAAATNVEVTLTYPPGLIVETDDTSPNVPELPDPPLPLAAPAGERRTRFERRFGRSDWERGTNNPHFEERQRHHTVYMTPDRSTVLVYRVARVEPGLMREGLSPIQSLTFPRWEDVADVEIAYEIRADGMDTAHGAVRGTVRVEPRQVSGERQARRERRYRDPVGAVLEEADRAFGGLLDVALGDDERLRRSARRAVGKVLDETLRFVDAVEGEAASRHRRPSSPPPPPASPARPPLSLSMGRGASDEGDGRRVLTRPARPRPGEHATMGSIESLVRQKMQRHPPLEELRRSGGTAGVSEEALRRYAREREEYADDLRAFWALHDEYEDRTRRAVRLGLEVENASAEEATGVYVRLTVPAGLTVESGATAPRNPIEPEPPLPLVAPPGQARRRFVRQFRLSWRDDPAEQHHGMGERPAGWSQFTMPDGSTTITYGPRTSGPGPTFLDALIVVFPSWEAVAPFTVGYEITSDWTAPARGELRVHAYCSATEQAE